ncbi:hypothetical protein [Actinocrispum sp. NPDC049592]|uniref:hypothetical protein n=1 Tax=Actinocrispum sp. NPDC049592 TaxID=3154835 RepID=UPI0034398EC9
MAYEREPVESPPQNAPQVPEAAAVERHPLYDLQGYAGNMAVSRLVRVQRQDATGGSSGSSDEPLDAAAVAAALSFYRAQPTLYTRQVIQDLRTRLGLDPAGGIDAGLAQAVARFQRDEGANDPALVIDGKAGPRSTPRLFPSGLAAAGEGATFGGEAQTEVLDEWDTLATAQARADALVVAVNRRLTAAGVPTVTAVLYAGESPQESGSFDFATWSMQLNQLRFDQSGLTQADAADLANTVYHEARHTEQWFMMARYLSGQGYSAAGIASTMGIPGRIGRDAKAAAPILRGTVEAVQASGLYESVYGSASAHREDVLTRLNDADWAVTTARCRCERAPSPANDALLAQAEAAFDVVHAQYRELPEENDAWATGPMGEAGVTSGTPHPVPSPTVSPCDQLRAAGRPVPAASGGSGP